MKLLLEGELLDERSWKKLAMHTRCSLCDCRGWKLMCDSENPYVITSAFLDNVLFSTPCETCKHPLGLYTFLPANKRRNINLLVYQQVSILPSIQLVVAFSLGGVSAA